MEQSARSSTVRCACSYICTRNDIEGCCTRRRNCTTANEGQASELTRRITGESSQVERAAADESIGRFAAAPSSGGNVDCLSAAAAILLAKPPPSLLYHKVAPHSPQRALARIVAPRTGRAAYPNPRARTHAVSAIVPTRLGHKACVLSPTDSGISPAKLTSAAAPGRSS